MTTLSATPPTDDREWFTPVWVVPALLLTAVIVYAIANGSIPEAAVSAVPALVAP
jgi:hypothetical protein